MGDGRGEVHPLHRRCWGWWASPWPVSGTKVALDENPRPRLVDRWASRYNPARPSRRRAGVASTHLRNPTFRTSTRPERLEGTGRPRLRGRPEPGCPSRGAGMPTHRGRLSVVIALAATCAL